MKVLESCILHEVRPYESKVKHDRLMMQLYL